MLKYLLLRKVNREYLVCEDIRLLLAAPVVTAEPIKTTTVDTSSASNILATPAVRRMAKDLQVEPNNFLLL